MCYQSKIKQIIFALFIVAFCALPQMLLAQNTFYDKLSDVALSLTEHKVFYDPAYVKIPYPNGDVPADKGVCTDVVIRAY